MRAPPKVKTKFKILQIIKKPLTIFVHRASECLTDYESHGDGLICFSLLNGLAERGHEAYAFANTAPIRAASSRLHVKTITPEHRRNALSTLCGIAATSVR